MKRFFFISILTKWGIIASAQLIITNPSIPTNNQPVTITFDATQGDAGLKGYTGEVYAHTGVITNLSTSNSDWKYVKAAWGTNIAACNMIKIATDKYLISISPSIRSFYGVPANEKILKIAFVFRSADGSSTGRDIGGADIFINVYSAGLNVSFINPSVKFSLENNNQKIHVCVSATNNDSICLFLDNIKIKNMAGQLLIDSIYATGTNLHTLISVAYKGTNSIADTVTFLVHGNTHEAKLPSGMHDGINYIDSTTVTFVLFAPFKNFIYLIGDFNNWTPNNSYLMSRDSNRFWITVNNLIKTKEYIFQYLIDGNIRIADPYSEKISDPDFDKNISSNIYPNLIQYPSGKTTGIAGVIQTSQPAYNWQATNFVAPSKNNLVVYELLIRDFTSNKDIKTITDSINYFKRLGINAIELMPFSEFDGNDSWGYNPDFYFAPDKAYGTREDYKKFIDVCHQNGIAVVQDMVLDFSTNNSPLVQMYFANGKPTAQNPWYDENNPNTSYSFGNVFNHESPYTRKLTDSITSFWMKEYKIDGFRFDFAKGWTNTIGEGTPYDASRIVNLELAADYIWKQNPKAYVILELFTANSEETVLANYGMMIWGNMNNNYCQAAMSYNDAGGPWDLSGMSYKNLGWNNPGLIGYMESHDEQRVAYKCETWGNASGSYNIKTLPTTCQRIELNNLFFLTIPGPKMIWQFGELGYDIPIDSGGRTSDKPVKWNYYNDSNRINIFNMVRTLNVLKQSEPVFKSISNFSLNLSGAVKTIMLDNANDKVLIIGNFDVVSQTSTIIFPTNGTWFEFFNYDSLIISGNSQSLTLNPGEFRMYSTIKLQPNYFRLPKKETDNQNKTQSIAFPNPFDKFLNVNIDKDFGSLVIYDVIGHLIYHSEINYSATLNTEYIKPGVYFLQVKLQSGDFKTAKILKL